MNLTLEEISAKVQNPGARSIAPREFPRKLAEQCSALQSSNRLLQTSLLGTSVSVERGFCAAERRERFPAFREGGKTRRSRRQARNPGKNSISKPTNPGGRHNGWWSCRRCAARICRNIGIRA
jgi:hypothetical protein